MNKSLAYNVQHGKYHCQQYSVAYLKVAKRVNFKISQHRKKNSVTMYGDK